MTVSKLTTSPIPPYFDYLKMDRKITETSTPIGVPPIDFTYGPNSSRHEFGTFQLTDNSSTEKAKSTKADVGDSTMMRMTPIHLRNVRTYSCQPRVQMCDLDPTDKMSYADLTTNIFLNDDLENKMSRKQKLDNLPRRINLTLQRDTFLIASKHRKSYPIVVKYMCFGNFSKTRQTTDHYVMSCPFCSYSIGTFYEKLSKPECRRALRHHFYYTHFAWILGPRICLRTSNFRHIIEPMMQSILSTQNLLDSERAQIACNNEQKQHPYLQLAYVNSTITTATCVHLMQTCVICGFTDNKSIYEHIFTTHVQLEPTEVDLDPRPLFSGTNTIPPGFYPKPTTWNIATKEVK